MNTYQALKCLADETANEGKLEEARAELRQFLDKMSVLRIWLPIQIGNR
jgi:hypothetical protein